MNIKQSVLNILARSGGDYVSGAFIAQQLEVSRNAVWKVIKSLESEGYAIDSITSKGYKISENSNKLSKEIILSMLEENMQKKFEITVYDDIDSTNNAAKELAVSGADNTVIIADRQTMGKGRMGRRFVSPAGKGVYMSILIRPDFDMNTAALITAAAACGTANAVESLCGHEVGIKWVNDLYMNGKKICGILTEASMGLETKSLDYAVIGIGVNVYKNDFGEELNKTVTSVEQESGIKINRNKLCAEIISNVSMQTENLKSRAFLEEYRRREILTGNIITANSGNQKITGLAERIDDNANLIIRLDDGTAFNLNSGEANLCRIKGDDKQ